MYGAQTYEKIGQRAKTNRGIRRMELNRVIQRSVRYAM